MDKENALPVPRKRILSDRYPLRDVQEGVSHAKQSKFAPTKQPLIRNQSNNDGSKQARARIHSTPSLSTLSNTISRNKGVAQPLRAPRISNSISRKKSPEGALKQPSNTLIRSTSTSRNKSPVGALKQPSNTLIRSNSTSRNKNPAEPVAKQNTTTGKRISLQQTSAITSNRRSKSPSQIPTYRSRSSSVGISVARVADTRNKSNFQQPSSTVGRTNSTSKNPAIPLNLHATTGTTLKIKSTLQQHKTLITSTRPLSGKNLGEQPISSLRSSSKPLKASHDIKPVVRKRLSSLRSVLPEKIEPLTSLNETQVLSKPSGSSEKHDNKPLVRKRLSGGKCMLPGENEALKLLSETQDLGESLSLILSELSQSPEKHDDEPLVRKRLSVSKEKIVLSNSLNETQVNSKAPPLISPYESPQKIARNETGIRSGSCAKSLEFNKITEERKIDESTYTITREKVSVETCKTSISKLFGAKLLSALPNFAKTASNLRSPSVESEEIVKVQESYEENKLYGLQAINNDTSIDLCETTKEDDNVEDVGPILESVASIEEDVPKHYGSFEFNAVSRFVSWFCKSKSVPTYSLPPLDLEDVNERELLLNTNTDEFVDPKEYFVLVTKCIKNNQKSELKYFQYWRTMIDKQIKANNSGSSVEIAIKFLMQLNSAFSESNAYLLRGKVLQLINGMETKNSKVYVTTAEIKLACGSKQNNKESGVEHVIQEKQPARKHTLHQKLVKRAQKNEKKSGIEFENFSLEKVHWVYRYEIDEYLRNRQENLVCPKEDSFNKTEFMARLDILNWVLTIQKELYLTTSMYFMVVRLFDHLRAVTNIPIKKYCIVCISLIWIITKCYGVNFLKLPQLKRLCNISGTELLDMEKTLLIFFDYKFIISEPGYFATDYLDRACISLYHQITYGTFFIMETFTYTCKFSQYEPSAVASGAVYLAFEILLPENDLVKLKKLFSPSDLDVLDEVVREMRIMLHKLSTPDYEGFQTTVLKYSGKDLKEVATEILKQFK